MKYLVIIFLLLTCLIVPFGFAWDTAPTTNLANGLIWIKKGSSPIEMYVYNGDTSVFNRVV